MNYCSTVFSQLDLFENKSSQHYEILMKRPRNIVSPAAGCWWKTQKMKLVLSKQFSTSRYCSDNLFLLKDKSKKKTIT